MRSAPRFYIRVAHQRILRTQSLSMNSPQAATSGKLADAPGSSSAAVLGPMEAAAAGEVMRSEIRRTQVMLGLVAMILGLVIFLVLTSVDNPVGFLPRAWLAIAALTGLVAYEGVVLFALGRWRRAGRSSGRLFRYGHTFAEVTFGPALVLASALLLGLGSGSAQLLQGATPWVAFIPIALSALYLDFWICAFAGTIAAIEFQALSVLTNSGAVAPEGWDILTAVSTYSVKSGLLFVTGLAAAFVAMNARRQMIAATRSVAERDRAVSMFGQHVSPQVAELLLTQPSDLEAEERESCIMFLDIRDFSKIAGERTPSEVVEYLNTLFGELIEAVNEHGGIVNKFLGDGFMAVFGAPVASEGAPLRAVEASMELLEIVERLNDAGSIPHTRVGIGLHTGDVVTGNVGSSDRKEYTIIGDAVNLASRIEQATKQFKANLLVSEAVYSALDAETFPAEDLGDVELKGQANPAHLFRLA
jgi:adenylate cyclase